MLISEFFIFPFWVITAIAIPYMQLCNIKFQIVPKLTQNIKYKWENNF